MTDRGSLPMSLLLHSPGCLTAGYLHPTPVPAHPFTVVADPGMESLKD